MDPQRLSYKNFKGFSYGKHILDKCHPTFATFYDPDLKV